MHQHHEPPLDLARLHLEAVGRLNAALLRISELEQRLNSTTAVPSPAAVSGDLQYTIRLEPDPVPKKPKRKSPSRRTGLAPVRKQDARGRWGFSLCEWLKTNMPFVSYPQVKPCLAIEGLLQKVHRYQKGKGDYFVTPLGDPFFFNLPYTGCKGHAECFVTPEGEAELFRLFRSGKLPLRPQARKDSRWSADS